MTTLLLFKIIFSVYISNQHVSAQAVKPLILYGDAVKIEDYPFYAGLNNCGATILSNSWILTAAHCVEDLDKRQGNYVWVGGETYANSLQVPYKYIYVHEKYKGEYKYNHDIALIKLSQPLKFTKKIQPIKLPNGPPLNSNITFVGRGRDETGQIWKALKKVDLIKLSIKECIKLMQPQNHVFLKIMKLLQNSDQTICTKREGNKPNLCKGDSGSPLISGDTILGVASFISDTVCEKSKLSFFVNVISFVPWIKSITGL